MTFLKRTVLVLLVVATTACSPECGPVTRTRCDGLEAQICDGDRRWQTFASCVELGPGWVCAETPGGALCLPAGELDAGAMDGSTA